MAKLTTRARQWRLEYAAKLGRPVTINEVADAIDEDRRTVMKIEGGKWQQINASVMLKLSSFYHAAGIDTRSVVEYDPNGILTPELVAA